MTGYVKFLSGNFDIGIKVRSNVRPLHYQSMVKIERRLFGRKPFETLSNIGLQVELTPFIGKMRPVTSPYATEVTSGHERSPAVLGNNF